jgi:predicted protein tyrosine phosphatase
MQSDNYVILKNLLLNNYDNNMFLTNQEICHRFGYDGYIAYNIWGIRDLDSYDYLECKSGLFLGVKKIYIIVKYEYDINPERLKDYIKNSGIEIKFFVCNLIEFMEIYQEFKHTKYVSGYYEFLDFAYSKKSEIYDKPFYAPGLPACLILPNLIIGESFDFARCKDYFSDVKCESYRNSLERIENLKKNGVSCIINVGNECVGDYFDKMVSLLKENNIEVLNYPLIECSEKNDHKINILHRVADLLHEKFNENKKVYLHCYMGKNRSVSCALMYMVKYMNMKLKDAYLNIALKRYIHPQKELIHIVYDEAIKKEDSPIALHKLIIDRKRLPDKYGYTSGSFAMGGYDIYMLDVIAGRKENPIHNDLIT